VSANSCIKIVCLSLVAVFFAACKYVDLETNFVHDDEVHAAIIDQTTDTFLEIDPLYISDEVKKLIDGYISPRDSEEARINKLQDILYREDFLNVQYSGEKTYTAMEAFHLRKGNCLSVMNLYVAMARYVNSDANFQTVEVQPSWDRRGNLLVLNQHINARGRIDSGSSYVVDFTPEISLQQLTSSVVSDQVARSLYFNNLGVEELIQGNLEEALVYFKNALFLYEESSIAWNNIGSAYIRLGNTQFAEYSYLKAFSIDRDNATSINNLAKYYRRSGNLNLAEKYEEAMRRFNDRNPYYHFAQGSAAFENDELEKARKSFRRALKLKKEEPDFYFALAHVYLRMGDVLEAKRYTDLAVQILATYKDIYQPSNDKVRIIDSSSILRASS